jgi:hypothetical protein
MLTTLSAIKSRISIPDTDTSQDAVLTGVINAISARFDHETNRTLARTENATHGFAVTDTEILPLCYPIESVSKFETKTSETIGWQEITPTPEYLIRRGCIISLLAAPKLLSVGGSALQLFRITYTGGYLLPGSPDVPGATRLASDLEQACVEQVAFWFQKKDLLGIKTTWPHGGTYEMFADQDLLDSVKSVLSSYRRWSL